MPDPEEVPAAGPAEPTGPADESADSDYEYDLAHEWRDEDASASPDEPHEPVYVQTQTAADDGGDYGYSLAHDVPGR